MIDTMLANAALIIVLTHYTHTAGTRVAGFALVFLLVIGVCLMITSTDNRKQ